MDDVIYRKDAVDALADYIYNFRKIFSNVLTTEEECRAAALSVLNEDEVPSAYPNLDEFCTDCKEYDAERNCCPRFNRVIRTALQDAQPERKKGRWLKGNTEVGALNIRYTLHRCSNCGFEHSLIISKNFCPNCGADMRGETDE